MVSIPNGMEFYDSDTSSWGAHRAFQFPTGWNSTPSIETIDLSVTVVSIPNGMEFYNGYLVLGCESSEFQFPTGWNSTAEKASIISAKSCFNSQRDGILRADKPKDRHQHKVSIPNGMEFYDTTNLYVKLAPACFNSQRDGILLFGLTEYPTFATRGFNSQRDGILQHEFCYFSR